MVQISCNRHKDANVWTYDNYLGWILVSLKEFGMSMIIRTIELLLFLDWGVELSSLCQKYCRWKKILQTVG